LSIPSSQLHAPSQIPKHADRIERIVGTRTLRCTTTDVLKTERRESAALPLRRRRRRLPPPFCAAGMR